MHALDTQDKNGKETNGFKSRMGSRAPAPRLLRLKPEDQPLLLGAPLRQGKFTWVTEAGREERWIVASCGNYTVLWNFRYHPDCCFQQVLVAGTVWLLIIMHVLCYLACCCDAYKIH